MVRRLSLSRWVHFAALALFFLLGAHAALADGPQATPNMFKPVSTPASNEFDLAMFTIAMTGGIFVVVGGIWFYVVAKFRAKPGDNVEPAQIYGSTQIELAWTVIPVILVVVLFLTTARFIFAIQDAPRPQNALDVSVVGHQFWWEFRYPKYGIVSANELHVPLSDPKHPTPTFLKLLSADVIHSFWVPQLAGKTDAIPNHENEMWVDPHAPGVYVGQCAQFCGTQHAKMLLRVYVDTPDQFMAWVRQQQRPAPTASGNPNAGTNGPAFIPAVASRDANGMAANASSTASGNDMIAQGRQVFLTQSCMNCHAVAGTPANGRFGPDLSHFGTRDTLGSGIAPNDANHLRAWIKDPADLKPGALMPAMQLDDTQIDQLVAYLDSLK
jgi:cytochrome c oxidase subunit II